MGIDIETARFLLQSRQSGCQFTSTATLGRQELFLCAGEQKRLMREFGFLDQPPGLSGSEDECGYAEGFWRMLGTQELISIDVSAYEHATLVYDLNHPLPEKYHGKFDAVCDGGTLEHVFNFPLAIASCMNLVKAGGRLFAFTPANNYCGHGFYQFSPELFYRIFSAENGFEVERMVAVEYGPARRWYEVSDPESIQRRVQLINRFPVLLLIQAKKMKSITPLANHPQQSDYYTAWKRADPERLGQKRVSKRKRTSQIGLKVMNAFPRLCRLMDDLYVSVLTRRHSFRNRDSFKPLRK